MKAMWREGDRVIYDGQVGTVEEEKRGHVMVKLDEETGPNGEGWRGRVVCVLNTRLAAATV